MTRTGRTIFQRDGLTPTETRQLEIVARHILEMGYSVEERDLDLWSVAGDMYRGSLLSCLLQWGEDYLSTRDDW